MLRNRNIYSNEDLVTLYRSGTLLAQPDTVYKAARFTVSLAGGMNLLLAAAGSCKDSAASEKVDTEPKVCTLPGVEDGNEGIPEAAKATLNAALNKHDVIE